MKGETGSQVKNLYWIETTDCCSFQTILRSWVTKSRSVREMQTTRVHTVTRLLCPLRITHVRFRILRSSLTMVSSCGKLIAHMYQRKPGSQRRYNMIGLCLASHFRNCKLWTGRRGKLASMLRVIFVLYECFQLRLEAILVFVERILEDPCRIHRHWQTVELWNLCKGTIADSARIMQSKHPSKLWKGSKRSSRILSRI